MQFMALPSNWWFNPWFGLQIQQSSGVLPWQFLFCDHLDGEERESWLLCLVCLPGVSWLLCGYSSQRHGLSAVCDCDTHYFRCHSCEQRWLWWRVCTFAWSGLSLRHSSKFSCGDSNGDWMPFCASCEGSGESAHLHRLTIAFVTVQNLLCFLKWRFVCYSRQQRILWWVCTFAQTNSLDNVIMVKISCAGSKGSWESARLHRLARAFFTVSKYNVLVEMAIFVTFMWTANDVVSLHQQPQVFCATISALYQCFKKFSQCVVVEFLNKTFASLPRKKIQSSNRFLDVISWEYDNSCA